MKEKEFMKGKKIKRVTYWPTTILKWIGRRDAQKGEQVLRCRIERWLAKHRGFENREVIFAEKLVNKVREAAFVIIKRFPAQTEAMSLPRPETDGTSASLRAVRRWKAQTSTARADYESGTAQLPNLYETMESIHTVLKARIQKGRELCASVICAYLSFTDASIEYTFDDLALEQYFAMHESTDKAIQNAVLSGLELEEE